MNKRMREILAEVDAKRKSAQAALAAKSLDEARGLLDEVDALEAEYELTERAYADAKAVAEEPAVTKAREQEDPEQVVKDFGRAAKRMFRKATGDPMEEGTDEDGGYLVPDDVSTRIERLRTAKASLLDLVTVVPVRTDKGSRTFRKRTSQTGFQLVAEGGEVQAKDTPKYDRYSYSIKKYGGFFPVTNELLADSDANVANELMTWIADESRVTANNLILAVLKAKSATTGKSVDDIKKAVNVTLGQAFAPTATIVTNDDGLNWLDTLKDSTGAPLLKSDPANPLQPRLAIGFRYVPLRVIPNGDLPSEAATKLPFFVGDIREGVRYFDRQRRSVLASRVAAAGDLNAFTGDLTIYRALEREDVVKRDDSAWVHLQINPSA